GHGHPLTLGLAALLDGVGEVVGGPDAVAADRLAGGRGDHVGGAAATLGPSPAVDPAVPGAGLEEGHQAAPVPAFSSPRRSWGVVLAPVGAAAAAVSCFLSMSSAVTPAAIWAGTIPFLASWICS